MILKNKRVLITGAGKRVGALLARTFANAGATVIMHAHNSQTEATLLHHALGSPHELHFANLLADDQIDRLFLDATQKGPIDILINNAASYQCESFHLEDIENAKNQFNLNFWAPYKLMQLIGNQQLIFSSIINVLDHQVENNLGEGTSYGISKKSLKHLTDTAAIALAPHTRVNALALGPVIPPENNPHAHMEKARQTSPLKRTASLDDIANAALFLIQNESITGQTLYVDCGVHLL